MIGSEKHGVISISPIATTHDSTDNSPIDLTKDLETINGVHTFSLRFSIMCEVCSIWFIVLLHKTHRM
jgi:hypothetical protein